LMQLYSLINMLTSWLPHARCNASFVVALEMQDAVDCCQIRNIAILP